MKCLRCNFVNPSTTNICKRCQTSLFSDSTTLSKNRINVYHDSGYLVIEPASTALPKRCYLCNSRDIVAMKTQMLEYVPALDAALEFAVGSILPIPLSSPRRKEVQLALSLCRRHRTYHRTFYKAGWGILIFGVFCFAAALALDNMFPSLFAYAMITSVVAFCIGMLLLYIEKEKEIVSQHKYQAPYFWVKGFGSEYLSSFPNWTNSAPR